MLQLIEVQCPHCGACGKVMIPPIGTIVIGPCPECHELVLVFVGRLLALDHDIMTNGTRPEQKSHIMDVIRKFMMEEKLDLLLDQIDQIEHGGSPEQRARHMEALKKAEASAKAAEAVTLAEVDWFKTTGVHQLDDAKTFHQIFG